MALVMSTLLISHSDAVITQDAAHRIIRDGSIFVRDNIIEAVGPAATLPATADVVIDARGLILLPGLVNTHHHFFQSLFRAVPGAQDQGLFDWLVRLFPIYGEITNEAVYVSSMTAMAEMILSGCTTSSDHLYLYPNGSTLDAQVQAADDIGIRLHATRGSMSLGRSRGGLPPDSIVQNDDVILEDSQRLIDTFHDPSDFSMCRIGLAPCTPFSVTKDLMRETARLARSHKRVRLHTHVAETLDEEVYCEREFGQRPVAYMEEVGWLGPDVWWAHTIHVNKDEIRQLAESGTGVAHCPSSNMRLGSGICPVRDMLDAGVNVGIGVDGSASNDCGHLIGEVRNALLLQRVAGGAGAFSTVEALELATVGGARVLGRPELGRLQPGLAADFIGVSSQTLQMAGGAVHDPLAALLLCHVDRVALSVINGRVIVKQGELLTVDLDRLIERHNTLAAEYVSRHPVPERFSLV
ncbi:MAG: 8-oxoguanine deaminase [Candidatus Azotimanducaceae bacterium]|jgi:8-oxoguanine deaminase